MASASSSTSLRVGVRSKAARISLHRFLMNINGTHLTPFSVDDTIPDAADGEAPKRKILTDEEVDAGFDLIREVVVCLFPVTS